MAIVTTFLESGTDATQDLSFFASTTGTVSSDTSQKYTGPRAAKGFTSNPAVSASFTSPSGILTDSGSQISVYFRVDTWAGGVDVIRLNQSGGLAVATISRDTATGKLKIVPAGATSATGNTVLVVNTWYRISLAYYITNTTTFQFKLYINGVLDATANAGTLTRTGTNNVGLVIGTGLGVNASVWFDNIYVATGGADSSSQPDTGNILVTAKRPNANGTANNFSTQIGAGGSGYGTGHSPQVNEQPLSTTNGWSMVGAGSAVTEEYNIEDASTGDVNISNFILVDYMGWIYTKSLVAETVQLIVNNVNNAKTTTTSAAMYIAAAGSTTYPAGTGTDIGEITDTSLTTVSLYECGIVVAYYGPGRGNFLLLNVG